MWRGGKMVMISNLVLLLLFCWLFFEWRCGKYSSERVNLNDCQYYTWLWKCNKMCWQTLLQEIFELKQTENQVLASSICRHDTGTDAVMNCASYYDGRNYFLACGQEEKCHLYSVKYKVITPKKETTGICWVWNTYWHSRNFQVMMLMFHFYFH